MIFKNRKFSLVLLAILSFCIIFGSVLEVNAVDEADIIESGQFMMIDFDISLKENKSCIIQSNNTVDVFICNSTEAGKYLANQSYSAAKDFSSISDLDYIINAREISSLFGLDYQDIVDNDQELRVYVFIENHGDSAVKFYLRYDYSSKLIDTLKHATNFGRLGFTVYLSIYLFMKARRDKSDNEIEKHHMKRGFGLTFLFASFAYLADILNVWVPRETRSTLYPDLKFQGILLDFISLRIDQLVFLTLILISDIFMIYEIEKVVGRKKRPIMTIMIGISILLNGFIFLIPEIVDIAVIWFVIALLTTIIQMLIIYGSVIKVSFGPIRKKSIAILLGFLLPLFMGFLGAELIPGNVALSYMIANIITIASVFMIKYGLD